MSGRTPSGRAPTVHRTPPRSSPRAPVAPRPWPCPVRRFHVRAGRRSGVRDDGSGCGRVPGCGRSRTARAATGSGHAACRVALPRRRTCPARSRRRHRRRAASPRRSRTTGRRTCRRSWRRQTCPLRQRRVPVLRRRTRPTRARRGYRGCRASCGTFRSEEGTQSAVQPDYEIRPHSVHRRTAWPRNEGWTGRTVRARPRRRGRRPNRPASAVRPRRAARGPRRQELEHADRDDTTGTLPLRLAVERHEDRAECSATRVSINRMTPNSSCPPPLCATDIDRRAGERCHVATEGQ